MEITLTFSIYVCFIIMGLQMYVCNEENENNGERARKQLLMGPRCRRCHIQTYAKTLKVRQVI